jgi:hypothetical protein
MLTLAKLIQSTASIRTKINDTNSFDITQLFPVPFKGNLLVCQARFTPLTDKKRAYYDTVIVFHGLSFQNTENDEHSQGWEILPGRSIYGSKPSLRNTEVSVSCLCADFYYMWWYFNKEVHSLEGQNFPRYKRKDGEEPGSPGVPHKTKSGKPGHSRGAVNPKKEPGLCKHLLVLAQYLASEGFITS